MKRMLALCYMHVTFLLKVRSDLVDSDLLQENTLTGKKSTFSFREKNHIQNHHKASNTGGNYITFNFVLLLIKGKEGLQWLPNSWAQSFEKQDSAMLCVMFWEFAVVEKGTEYCSGNLK